MQVDVDHAVRIELDPDGVVDVVLHWQQWKLRSPSLDRVRDAVLAAARDRLDQGGGPAVRRDPVA